MPHSESERRREFLRWTLSQNAAAHSEETQADLINELNMLDSFYRMDQERKPEPETQPDLLANRVAEPDLKGSEISINAGKFNS